MFEGGNPFIDTLVGLFLITLHRIIDNSKQRLCTCYKRTFVLKMIACFSSILFKKHFVSIELKNLIALQQNKREIYLQLSIIACHCSLTHVIVADHKQLHQGP